MGPHQAHARNSYMCAHAHTHAQEPPSPSSMPHLELSPSPLVPRTESNSSKNQQHAAGIWDLRAQETAKFYLDPDATVPKSPNTLQSYNASNSPSGIHNEPRSPVTMPSAYKVVHKRPFWEKRSLPSADACETVKPMLASVHAHARAHAQHAPIHSQI